MRIFGKGKVAEMNEQQKCIEALRADVPEWMFVYINLEAGRHSKSERLVQYS